MKKARNYIKFYTVVLSLLLIPVLTFASEDWKVEQEKIFSQIPVKPGDKIDKSNWETVKDLLPPNVAEWIKVGDLMEITIGALKDDYDVDDRWKKKTAANAGKYEVDGDGNILEKATGKVPMFYEGEPFPNIDWKNDPNAGVKLAYNFTVTHNRSGSWEADFTSHWIGRGGPEKILFGTFKAINYPNIKDYPNPENLEKSILTTIREPYDIRGLISLTKRHLSDKSDSVWTYVPSIRRVKRMSGANRSDPFAGNDSSLDDANGWDGKNSSMEWKILDKKIILVPLNKEHLGGFLKYNKNADGSWTLPADKFSTILGGYQTPGWNGAPWLPTNVLYVPMNMYVVEAIPKDKYYNYGRMVYYIGTRGTNIHYKVIYDKALEHWKSMVGIPIAGEWGEGLNHKKAYVNMEWYLFWDHNTDHTTAAWTYGLHDKYEISMMTDSKQLSPAMFRPSSLSAQSR